MSDQKDFIPLAEITESPPSGQPRSVRAVSQEEFDKHRRILDWTFGFIVAVLIVCFTSFVVFIVDAWKFHSETLAQNSRIIEQLNKENQEFKFQVLSKRVEELERLLAAQNQQTPNQNIEKNRKK